MAEVLLLNPAKRRRARRKNPSAAQLRARARFAAASRARSRAANPARKRRRNPLPVYAAAAAPNPRRRRRVARRRNPALRSYRAASRRRNPIGSSLNLNAILGMAKEAAVMGAGAVAMDIGYSYVSRYLPASMQAGPGTVSVGSVVKLGLTAAAGRVLSKATRGLSNKAAIGAMTVQFRDIVSGMVPAGVMSGVGYSVPARVINRTARIGPNGINGVGQYTRPGSGTPLLSGMGRYTAPGSVSPLLSGSAREREGFAR